MSNRLVFLLSQQDKGYDLSDLPLPSVMEGAVSDAKTALGSEQLNCLKALTALRIAYLNQKDCCINKPVLFIYLFFQC
jgi:hypothetical protein